MAIETLYRKPFRRIRILLVSEKIILCIPIVRWAFLLDQQDDAASGLISIGKVDSTSCEISETVVVQFIGSILDHAM
jgi:hypothetical protein